LQPLISENHLIFGNAGLAALLGDKKPLSNLQLFQLRIA